MKDFINTLILLEKIDPQYKKYKEIKRELNEAADSSFSVEALKYILSFDEARQYCVQHLGQPIGQGSSRIVFQIDDAQVLKLATNSRGVAQNRVEAKTKEMKLPIFPYILYNADNYQWIITEFVLPAEEEDIQHCLGIDVRSFLFFVIQAIKDLKYCGGLSAYQENFADEYGDCEFYRELEKYILNYDIQIGDIQRIENWGLTKRNGKECLVILDPGWNKETMLLYGCRPSDNVE